MSSICGVDPSKKWLLDVLTVSISKFNAYSCKFTTVFHTVEYYLLLIDFDVDFKLRYIWIYFNVTARYYLLYLFMLLKLIVLSCKIEILEIQKIPKHIYILQYRMLWLSSNSTLYWGGYWHVLANPLAYIMLLSYHFG